MQKILGFMIGVALAAALTLCIPGLTNTKTPAEPQPPSSPREHLIILHINDTHGRLEPHTVKEHSLGGVSQMATLIKQIRQENPQRVLLLHAGDALSDGDQISRRYQGQADIDLMNRMGFNAMVLGNGEYYGGMDILRQRMTEAKFTILAGNIFQQMDDSSQPVGQNYIVKQVGPLRAGILGLSLIRSEHPACVHLRTGDNLKLAQEWLDKLRPQCDVVVLLSHLGLTDDTMMAGMLNGVDLVVGGHTHNALAEPAVVRKNGQNSQKIYIVQAGQYYEYLGRVDMDFEPGPEGNWQLKNLSARLIPVEQTITPDPEIASRLEEYRRGLTAAQTQPISQGSASPAAEPQDPAESLPALPQAIGAGLEP